MDRFRFLCNYIRHFFTASNTRGFGVHSPFVYQFTIFVLYEKHYFYVFTPIETLRNKLKRDKRIVNIKDFGTGNDRQEAVKDIATRSLKSAKYGQLLFRLVHYFKATHVLELGTSLGITTSYLAASSAKVRCHTLEGCPEVAHIAQENFKALGLNNISLHVGNIDEILSPLLESTARVDFVFFDANHTFDATISYFELCAAKAHRNSVFVVDDIYWSEDMEKAWKKIMNHPRVTSTIDLFRVGIVFFNTDLYKKHYKMRY